MNYMEKIEQFFWDNLENDELQVNDNNYDILNQTIRLMDLNNDHKANVEIDSNPELQLLFGFRTNETINVISEVNTNSDTGSKKQDLPSPNDSEDSEDNIDYSEYQNLRPANIADIPKDEEPETSGQGANRNTRKRKGNFFPINDGKNTTNIFGSNILDIDCRPDRKEIIDKWAQEISLIIQTNKDAYDDSNTVLLLAEHKTTGIINSFIKNTTWYLKPHPMDTFKDIIDAIYTMFLGIDFANSKEAELKKISEKAKHRLTNMTLCDICFLDQFYCDYEKNLYLIKDQGQYKKYVLDYLLKIPIVGEKANNRFIIESMNSSEYSLGFAQRIVKEEISLICDLARKQRKLKRFNKSCCKSIEEPSLEYGCKPIKTRKIRKQKQKFVSKRFKKKHKSFIPGKFVRKKNISSDNRKKFCPKGKKNCRCWVCNEEGHYANECPNRKQYPDKIKMLEEIICLDFVPIEDPYEGKLDVFLLEELDPGPESSESDESSSSNSESD